MLRRRGWHHDRARGIHYYHHPSRHGLIAVHFGTGWFWIHYYNSHWYWYHPHYRRWVVRVGDHWWYHHSTLGWCIWHEDLDRFYAVQPGRIVRERLPPPPGEEGEDEDETVYYNEAGTLAVYVLGAEKMAHLYTYPEREHVAYLGEGVKSVRFSKDRYNEEASVIVVEFEDGQLGFFNEAGELYGAAPAAADPDAETPRESIEGELGDLPGGITAPDELPEPPVMPEAGPVQL